MNIVPKDDRVLRLQEIVGRMPQAELETFHYFADGMYARVLPRKEGTLIVGKVHKREHFYIVAKGSVKVFGNGEDEAKVYTSGTVIVSRPGTKRAVYALEDSICMTVHRTEKTDIDEIERELIEEDTTATFDAHNRIKDREDYERILIETGFTAEQRKAISENTSDQIPMPPRCDCYVSESEISGLGLFAAREFTTGETIVPARIGVFRTPAGRYTNHSARPNAKMVCEGNDIHVVATDLIDNGQEITVDYRQAKAEAEKCPG
jgi:SET domain-containing protein